MSFFYLHKLETLTTFLFLNTNYKNNIMGDELLLNFGTKFQH